MDNGDNDDIPDDLVDNFYDDIIRCHTIAKSCTIAKRTNWRLRFTYGNLVTTFTSSKCYSLDVFSPARQREPPSKQSEVLTKTLNR